MSSPATSYTLERFSEPSAFAAAAKPFLLEREATNCLQLGLIDGIGSGEWRDPFMALIARDGEPALVALRTPPHNLLLSHTDDPSAAAPLLAELTTDVGGVLGPAEVADAFANAWSNLRGASSRLTFRQRIYRCERVEPVTGVEGAGRTATEADRPLLEEWMGCFLQEALPGKRADAATTLDRWLGSPGRELRLWQLDGEPVAMAGAGSRTPNGVRISAVFTPPARRGRGYASALVADLSQRQFDSGSRFCFLFTDLANPTSNHIYQALGYRPVSDAHEYSFSSVDPTT